MKGDPNLLAASEVLGRLGNTYASTAMGSGTTKKGARRNALLVIGNNRGQCERAIMVCLLCVCIY